MTTQTTTPLTGRRILLVEDDYLLADALAQALRSTGALVSGPIGTVDGALAAVAELDDIEAVVLDVNLNGIRVDAVADAVRARGVPMVFVSGYDRNLLPPRFADVPHCLKPVDIDQLAATLAAQLRD
ncbi:response regulator [Luteimonas terrae]|uniref:Response regulator n=1 Tax=Luteimonas terrae TaxID=1530191 RepID=A0A4R5U597_9GAMM|nr:response regulator [Luteimonas terrae]TDK28994.1 response regulator [Luteimonas terrae]